MSMIPAEAVEAAAKAFDAAWEYAPHEWSDSQLEKMRAALEAAAPHMLAEVWQSAYTIGYADCQSGASPTRKNPHKDPL